MTSVLKALVDFKKAVAKIDFKKAVASIVFGDFLIFKIFADAFGATDSQAKDVAKPFSDSQGLSDSAITGLNKIKSDQSGITDSSVLNFNALKTDSGQTSDSINTLTINKGLQDSSAFTEIQNMNFHKFVEEETGVTDDLDGEATTNDDQEMTFVKVRSNLATMVDSFAHSTGTGLSDTIGSSDSGSLRGQGYCAFDYFEADYVGYSQSF